LLLEVNGLETAYGMSQVLFGISLSVQPGEAVTLLGRNGMGKTTTIRSIMGLTRARSGTITFRGKRIEREAPDRIARMGMALVPEGRQIFPNLSVRENLAAFAENRSGRADPWTPAKVLEFFPRLAERVNNMGNQLSGGEQQMLSIARALLNAPKLLMLDEPVEGLAPVIVDEIVDQIKKIRATGVPILLVEQNLAVCTELADRHYILELGRVVYHGTHDEFAADEATKDRYLGVKAH
jgi:branched-chain amino acid transport system ATP-binding protein